MLRRKAPAADETVADIAKRMRKQRDAMARRIERQARSALSKAAEAGVKVTDWEQEFLSGVSDRLQTFGRAFADPEKGDPSMPLSIKQSFKMNEIKRSIRKKVR